MDGSKQTDNPYITDKSGKDKVEKHQIKPFSLRTERTEDLGNDDQPTFDYMDLDNVTMVQPSSGKLPLQQSYAAKKTVAQGMMDVALITANANQMKFVLNADPTPSNKLVIALIVVSLALQMAVGVSLIFKGRYDLQGESKLERANRINNYVVVGIFLITLLNVFIAALSDTSQNTVTQ